MVRGYMPEACLPAPYLALSVGEQNGSRSFPRDARRSPETGTSSLGELALKGAGGAFLCPFVLDIWGLVADAWERRNCGA